MGAEHGLQDQYLADSIEGVAILALPGVPPFLSMFDFATPALVFIPEFYLGHLDISGGPLTRSLAWKANTVDVFDLEQRFETELKDWPRYDSAHLMSQDPRTRGALASALGVGVGEELEKALAPLKNEYLFGYSIGEAVGKEHSNQWLAMDLKLEHFIMYEHIWHVDHDHDVFLFREPTAEECARSIAPLYQQMSYPLWHAFREGYWDTRRREALDVFLIFDDWVVGEILGVRAVANAVNAREDDWQAALAWCDDAESAFNAFRQGNQVSGSTYLSRLKLVRGDIYIRSRNFEDALTNYDSAQEELELLRAEGVLPEFDIVEALINSAYVLTKLDRRREARDRLLRAKTSAAKLPSEDPRTQPLVHAASISLNRLGDSGV